jgi:hypothetical protein
MMSAVNLFDSWIPNLVEPGSVLVLNSSSDDLAGTGTFCALMNCPCCGRLEVITEQQFQGEAVVTCGASDCPARFFVKDGTPLDAMPLN